MNIVHDDELLLQAGLPRVDLSDPLAVRLESLGMTGTWAVILSNEEVSDIITTLLRERFTVHTKET